MARRGVLHPSDLEHLLESNEAIKLYLFLLDLSGPDLMKHRMVVAVAVELLKMFFGLVALRNL